MKKIEFRLEKHLFKYYSRKYNVETFISRYSIPAMMALGQLKNRYRSKKQDYNAETLTHSVFFICTTGKYFKHAIRFPSLGAQVSFNNNIKTLFLAEFYSYMDAATILQPETNIKDHLEPFLNRYDLSEEDISSESLLRSYRRHRYRQQP